MFDFADDIIERKKKLPAYNITVLVISYATLLKQFEVDLAE